MCRGVADEVWIQLRGNSVEELLREESSYRGSSTGS